MHPYLLVCCDASMGSNFCGCIDTCLETPWRAMAETWKLINKDIKNISWIQIGLHVGHIYVLFAYFDWPQISLFVRISFLHFFLLDSLPSPLLIWMRNHESTNGLRLQPIWMLWFSWPLPPSGNSIHSLLPPSVHSPSLPPVKSCTKWHFTSLVNVLHKYIYFLVIHCLLARLPSFPSPY